MDEAVLGALAEARALGFLGPGPLEAHERSATAFAEALGDLDGCALDLGSGGGVPGLLLAARYPQVRWTLLDANRRRTSFLARAVAGLGWSSRVEVVRAQAEEAAHRAGFRASFGTVVSRSFGPPALTAECAVGFLAPGGRLAVAEPPDALQASRENRWPEAGLRAVGLERIGSPTARVVLLRQGASLPAGSPRPLRAMQRHPLW